MYGLSFPRFGETLDENGALPFNEDAVFIKSTTLKDGLCVGFKSTKDVEEIELGLLVANANEGFTIMYKVCTTVEETEQSFDGFFVGARPIRRPH